MTKFAKIVIAQDATGHDPRNGQFAPGTEEHHNMHAERHAALMQHHEMESTNESLTPKDQAKHTSIANAHYRASAAHERAAMKPSERNIGIAAKASNTADSRSQKTGRTTNLSSKDIEHIEKKYAKWG